MLPLMIYEYLKILKSYQKQYKYAMNISHIPFYSFYKYPFIFLPDAGFNISNNSGFYNI